MDKKRIHIHLFATAKKFIEIAQKQESEIYLEKGLYRVNAKSIMGILSIDASEGEVFISYDKDKVSEDFIKFVESLEV